MYNTYQNQKNMMMGLKFTITKINKISPRDPACSLVIILFH